MKHSILVSADANYVRNMTAENTVRAMTAEPAMSWKTPFDLFTGKNEKKLLDLLNLRPVPPDEVMLSPKLLNLGIR